MKIFKGQGEVISVNHWDREWDSSLSPTVCRLVDLLYLPLDIILFTQFFHEITEGEAKKEIWSSVNYLCFISTFLSYGENWQFSKVLCDQKIWKLCLDQRWVKLGVGGVIDYIEVQLIYDAVLVLGV